MMSLLQVGETELKLTRLPGFGLKWNCFSQRISFLFRIPTTEVNVLISWMILLWSVKILKMTLPWVIRKSIGYTWRVCEQNMSESHDIEKIHPIWFSSESGGDLTLKNFLSFSQIPCQNE